MGRTQLILPTWCLEKENSRQSDLYVVFDMQIFLEDMWGECQLVAMLPGLFINVAKMRVGSKIIFKEFDTGVAIHFESPCNIDMYHCVSMCHV